MAEIVLHPSGAVVPCADGRSVLEALERAGFALRHNCRAGACGECKVLVRAGEFDQGFVLDFALDENERAAGYGLMCKAVPTSDVLVIDYPEPAGASAPPGPLGSVSASAPPVGPARG